LAEKHGLLVVAVSTLHGALYSSRGLDRQQLLYLAEKYEDNPILSYSGGHLIELDAFFKQKMDCLCLCADSYPIHPGNVDEIVASIIVAGCNLAATPETEARLHHRRIVYLPGFVCNSGGVLCHILSEHGFEEDEIKQIVSRGVRNKVAALLDLAKKVDDSPASTALQIVARNQKRFAEESEASLKGKSSLALTRLRHSGIKEIIRTGLWPLVNGSLSRPPSFRRKVAREILLARLFSQ
jgi:glutamate dehydrogenase/leucine dehydrogenase